MSSISDALQELQRQFAEALPGKLQALHAQFQTLSLSDWQLAEAQALHYLIHSLTGSAGTFGMESVSAAARQLEVKLKAIVEVETAPDEVTWAAIGAELTRIEQLAHSRLHAEAPSLMPPQVTPRLDRAPLVYLVEDNIEQAEHLAQVLGEDGYQVRVFSSLAEFRVACAEAECPDALVLDVIFPEGDSAGIELLAELKVGWERWPPVVFTSVRDDLDTRLAAYRAGASRYLLKPVVPEALVDLLDALTGRMPPESYRVLLVDDDPLLLQAQASVLRATGMTVQALDQPRDTLNILDSFRPDVMVLDVYMPEVSGPELAAIIRERDEYLSLPILFLSAETDMSQQLLALNLGGDDFLVKPVQPVHLVSAVTARARRARQNRALQRRLRTSLYERERQHLALNHHAIVSIADRKGDIIAVNDKFCQISGYTRDELLGHNHRIVKSGEHPPAFFNDLWRTISDGNVWHGEICNLRKDGELYWVSSTITPFLDDNGKPYQYVSIRTDITQIRAAEAMQRKHNAIQAMVGEASAGLLASSADSLDAAIEQALCLVGKRFGVERAYLFLLSANDTRMSNTHEWCAPGIAPQKVDLQDMYREAAPWWWEQILRDQPVIIPDVAALPPEAAAEKALFQSLAIPALTGIPIRRGDRTLGFVGMDHQTGFSLDDTSLNLLCLLADNIGSALVRAISERKVQEQFCFTEDVLNSLSAQIAVLDRDGVIVAVNERWRCFAIENSEQAGVPAPNTDIGSNYLDVCRTMETADSLDMTGVVAGLESVMTGHAVDFRHEYPCHSPTKSRWFEMRVVPLSGEDGGVVVSHLNITERKLAEITQRDSAERLNATLESTKDGILAVDDSGTVLFTNQQFRQMWNMPVALLETANDEQLIAHALTQLVDPQGFMEKVQALYQSDKPSEDLIELLDGRLFERYSQALHYGGRLYGRVWSFHDITERLHAKQAAELATERLRYGQIFANIGTWEWNIESGELFWTERIAPLFGYPDGDLETSYDNFLAAIHPDDRQRVIDAVNACLEHDTPYDIEHRVVWPDGTVRWLLERGAVRRDDRGQPLQMLGVVQDIDARKRAELSLQLFSHVFHSVVDGVVVIDSKGIIQTCNPATSNIFGYPASSMKGNNISMLMPPSIRREHDTYLHRYLATGERRILDRQVQVSGMRSDGTEFPLEAAVSEILVEQEIFFVGLLRDITERKLSEQAMIDAREEADRANQAKSEFLSSMSHELRTPMNAILGFGQIMEYDETLPDEHLDNVQEILKAGRHLLDLINEVLDLAKIESGRLDLSLEPVKLRPVVEECFSLINSIASKRSIRLTHSALEEAVVRADRTRLKQVLLNLLSNAVKYNHDGGSVLLEVCAEGDDRVRILVKDTGPGISADRLAELFQPFNRLGAETSQIEGTGIGLTITQRLVEMMGGMVDVKSEIGVGSTFWIELPLDYASNSSCAPKGTRQKNSEVGSDDTESHTVLYIEDNSANLKLVTQILGHVPHIHLITAHTPSLGIELALARLPELILLDINMPGMDGYQVLKVFQAEASLKNIPVIAITANAMPRDIERGMAAGFVDYLT